jgi:iduronate 2-sulfatase
MLFNRAYCQIAICIPSRASIMSGCYPLKNRMYQRKAMFEHMPDVLSLNQHFLNHGYATVNIGKIYHYSSDEATGWSRNFRNLNEPWSRGYITEAALELESRGKGSRGPAYENAQVDDSGYQTARFADKAIEELRNIGDKPLFFALGFRKPHLPFNAPRKYRDLYDHDDIQLTRFPRPPKNAAKEGFADWGELRKYDGIPKEGPLSEAMSRNLIHAYYACVSYVDAQLGRVLDELDRLGLRENTVIVLWGDHGWKLGDYGMWCKHTDYEIDARVPLIVSAPGMKGKGACTDALVELVDLYPTLCELAGLDKPPHLQGSSFKPLLDDADFPFKEAAFSLWIGNSATAEAEAIGYSVRSGSYRYTEWRDTQTDTLVARELYDHSEGSLVSANVVDLPGHTVLLTRLSGMLGEWRRKYGGETE